MPTLQAGQTVSIQLAEGESYTVTPSGTAQVSTRGVSGSELSTPRTLTSAQTFGPYTEAGSINIACLTGSALYAQAGGNWLTVRDSAVQAPTSNPTAVVGSAGVLTGAYYYATIYELEDGTLTEPWSGTATVVNPSSQQVNLTNIPVSPSSRVVARWIVRTPATPVDPKDYRLCFRIADNTTTTATDNTADGSLGAPVNWPGTANGTIIGSLGQVAEGLGSGSFAQALALGANAHAGYASVHVGFEAGKATTTGRRNTSVGVYSLTALTTGYENTSLGVHAGNNLTTGYGNTFLGYSAGFNSNGTCALNTLVGSQAGQGTASGLGQQLVALGHRALFGINTADQCVGIGPFAGQYANASRQLFIDTGGSSRANLAGQQNEGLIYGEIPNAGNVQTQRLNLNGSVRLGSSTSPTVANLPAAAAGLQGCRRYVTDASVAYTSANLGSTVAGGGSNCVPVFCNGTAWVIG